MNNNRALSLVHNKSDSCLFRIVKIAANIRIILIQASTIGYYFFLIMKDAFVYKWTQQPAMTVVYCQRDDLCP